MRYDFRTLDELAWVVVMAATAYLGQLLTDFSPDAVTDWRTYAISALAGLGRAVLGALLARRPAPS